jgi:hypothetical protein
MAWSRACREFEVGGEDCRGWRREMEHHAGPEETKAELIHNQPEDDRR